ncbi:Glycosyl transferase family 2 [Lactobacillus bombicola]|uniref:Glycosyl transferase family 2 n=1 Tax=Lactobacillus bombicola TaxID=1505723 RepID=A0A1I1TLD4_9LACO|nr:MULTISPECIES: glycosyltransferase family A protein [Lactobacillus]MCO6528362.1 glycosyltransferase family 2 protein [Lactobacillus sp.]RMC42732.1 glycosyltransferase family 2 protein [Lactobacillus sp. ESL0233]SFD59367.1 Glycosyl transferase family 2 [Lactobacillus bombicola]
MIQQPELTVIMPIYNVEKYISRALDHLAKQDNMNFKLLIVNDGSTDNTKKIVESYQTKFRYIQIINKPNSGLSDARNVGLAHVDTPYFTFHDGDDWVDSGYTDFFIQAFHKHPEVAMVSCGFWLDYENKIGSKPVTKKVIKGIKTKLKSYQLINNPLGSLFDNHILGTPVKGYTWNKGYKISVVRQNHLCFMENLAFMEDQIFNVEYLALTDGFYCTSRPLYHYWQRKDSMVHNFNLKMIPDNFKANYIITKIIIRSLWQEHKKEDNSKQKLVEASERNRQ